ncbi:hypothetical protein AXYL_04008 [Achromobacter xylosoxidans A8]|uniref:Uncharacterized protein n=1 Tax=Achromobacter xylosoxidans (strain A8) TaxID=762376 RepID=E3HSL1_ACHXA|nr:hypothetical protein [Achromobacter xylosoxidans]ADP17328.1 hypothetical protein AXYL_04008 [Achromobacter xylosoxidans A8]
MNPLLRAAAPYLIGAALVAVSGLCVAWYGSHREAAGVTRTQLEAAANARQIEAQYRRQEQEMAAEYASRLENANEAIRLSNAERDSAAGAADSLRDAIVAQRARAAQAAARAGLSEQAATRAWDVLKACTDEYAALARDADGVIDGMREGDAWAKALQARP